MATATSATNASLALSGLASGIDWTSIVNELLTIERAPETQMQTEQAADQKKNTAYQGIGTQLTTLANDIANLSDPSFFDNRTTTSTDPSVATATAAAAAPQGNYKFVVGQMATDAVQQGSTNITSSLSPTDDVSTLTLSSADFANPVTAGTFTVDGQAITISTGDTLQSVFDQINTKTGGAVTASYSQATDEITLTSNLPAAPGTPNPIVLGSATDTSNFLQVAQLYNNGTASISSTSRLGGINLANNLASANFVTPITNGTPATPGGTITGQFLINGVAINFDTATDGVKDVLNRINNSSAGVTATYDSINGRFQLTSKTTGDVGITLQDVNGNFLAATGLSSGTLQRGTDLQYTVNDGGTITSHSNVIDQTSSGITGLTVTALDSGPTTISINSDTAKISSAINSFVTDYNAAQSFISTQVTPSTDSSGNMVPGVLTGDMDVENISNQLRQLADAVPIGLTGSIKNILDLGIASNGINNSLSITDTTALSSALANNLDAVKQLFTNTTNGIGTTLKAYLSDANGTNGALATDEANMTKQSTDITTSIASLETRISNDQTRLTNEFVAMETAINNINTQKQYLNSYFSSSGSSQAAPTAAGSSSSG